MSLRVDASSIDKALKRWWSLIIKDLENEIRAEILEQNLVYTGRMANSIKARAVVSKKIFRVAVDVPYASCLERGKEHVYANVDELMVWAMVKKRESREEARNSAWAIAMALRKRGLKGRYFVRQAVRRFIRKYKVMTET